MGNSISACEGKDEFPLLQNLTQSIIQLVLLLALLVIGVHFTVKLWCDSKSEDDATDNKKTNLDIKMGIGYKILLSLTMWMFIITICAIGLSMVGCLIDSNDLSIAMLNIGLFCDVIGSTCLIGSFLIRLNQTFIDTPFAYNSNYYVVVVTLAIVAALLGIIGTIFENFFGTFFVIASFIVYLIMAFVILWMFITTVHKVCVTIFVVSLVPFSFVIVVFLLCVVIDFFDHK